MDGRVKSLRGDLNGNLKHKDFYFVCSRGDEKRVMFYDNEDYNRMLLLMAYSADLYETEIPAYSLMSNHYHLVVYTNNIKKFIPYIRRYYSSYFNAKYNKSGRSGNPTCQYSKLVPLPNEDPSESLRRVVADKILYVLRNPVHHGVCDSPFEYRWTSLRTCFNSISIDDGWTYSMTECKKVKLLLTDKEQRKFLPKGKHLLPNLLMDNQGFVLPESFVSDYIIRRVFKSKIMLYRALQRESRTEIFNKRLEKNDRMKRYLSMSPYQQKLADLRYKEIIDRENSKVHAHKDVQIIKELKVIGRDINVPIFNNKNPYTDLEIDRIITELLLRLPYVYMSQCHRILDIPYNKLYRYFRS